MVILTALLNTVIVLICVFLICLILIQRGKGGGLAGAFGGVGGSSAFGTKSGDVFTRVTMIVASVWILMSMLLVILYNQGGQSAWGTDAPSALTKEVAPRDKKTTAPIGTSPAPPSAPGASTSVPAIPDVPAKDAAPATTPPAATTPAAPSAPPAVDATKK